MNTRTLLLALALALVYTSIGAGCSPFQMTTPSSMVELTESRWSAYDYRATTPEGVVISARQIRQRDGARGDAVPRGDIEFWADAVQLRLRTRGGYALLSQEDVMSADGTSGTQLRFGRDQGESQYAYWITLYVTDRFVHVIEAGGPEDLFEEEITSIERAMESYRVRR